MDTTYIGYTLPLNTYTVLKRCFLGTRLLIEYLQANRVLPLMISDVLHCLLGSIL
jgi:hypothetical protein